MTLHEEYMDYRQTGMLDSYRPERIWGRATDDGKIIPHYPDIELEAGCGEIGLVRELVVDGRLFRVHSVFDLSAKKPPTEAMLRIIDSDLEKDSHSG